MNETRPPYRIALGMTLVVLAGYLFTLAPSVTFWDAGEFIAAARTLGVPHPPGTPLFVMLAHVWGTLFVIGEFAWRLNVLSALCASLAAGCWFLVAHEAADRMFADVDERARQVLAGATGAAAALFTAFNYTTWQNATETEVYSVAMLIIALSIWLALRWRAHRGRPLAPKLLLLVLYLAGLSVGNHLLALLIGPAIVALLLATSWQSPLVGAERNRERARIFVVGAVWLLLIAVGLGSTALATMTGTLVVVAMVWATSRGELRFALAGLGIALLGVTPYLFLLLRSRQGPWLNEADPSTWDALLAVIRRAQYPIRTPLDDPTVLHGPGNPGRTLTIFGYQVANFAQYFDYQWARSIGAAATTSYLRLAVTLGIATLGVRGAFAQRRSDRGGFWLMLLLVLVTGPALVVYMNFKPGPSIGWERWPVGADHEVRERDYFFVACFVAWGVWAALGLADLVRNLMPRVQGKLRPAMLGLFAIALIPPLANFRVATRRQTPEATFARDVARAMLQSVPPGGILFTWGDNDTFPLWYVQAAEGVRRDVTVVCLALSETSWYLRELRDAPRDPVDREHLAAIWRDAPEPDRTLPLIALTDAQIESLRPAAVQRELAVPLPNGITVTIPGGSSLFLRDLAVLYILQQNAGKRPVAWSITAAQSMFGLGPHVVQTGLAAVLPSSPVDSSALVGGDAVGPDGAVLDLTATRRLIAETWDFGRLEQEGVERLDPNVRLMASTVAIPMMQAGVGLLGRGDTTAAIALLERAERLTDSDFPKRLLAEVRTPFR